MSVVRAVIFVALALCLAGEAAAASKGNFQRLLTEFEHFMRAQDPIRSAQRGDVEAASRWPDDRPAAVAARKRELESFRTRVRRLAKAKLNAADALERDVMADRIATMLEGLTFDEERMPFISGEGFFVNPDLAAAEAVLKDEGDAERWLKRLEALPDYYDVQIANMRRGIKTRFTQPRLVVEAALRTTRAQAEQPADQSPLLEPLTRLPETVPAATRQAFTAHGLEIVRTKVKPAQTALVRFFEEEYLPAARPELGARSLPDGERYYAYLVRHHTTTTLTPDEVHAKGLKEVARIRGEMDTVIAQTKFKGTFAEFLAFLRSDPQFYPNSPDALMEKASEISNRVNRELPHWFATLPRLTYAIVFIPETLKASSAGYWTGNPHQGVAGQVLLRREGAEKRTLYDLPSWVLHEGAPGHHIQIALAEEQTDLPEYRRNDDVTAFVEGWALYSEYLGEEMGLYRTPYEHFGRLSMEMWRACRLVIDTGMHWMGWTRDQAVACLRDNSALAPDQIEHEADRYIGWPGQALAYKIGDEEIRDIRARTRAKLGACFDIRRFHDALLGAGPLPMELLDRRMAVWSQTEKRTCRINRR